MYTSTVNGNMVVKHGSRIRERVRSRTVRSAQWSPRRPKKSEAKSNSYRKRKKQRDKDRSVTTVRPSIVGLHIEKAADLDDGG